MNTHTQSNGSSVYYGDVVDSDGRVVAGGLTERQRDEVRALFRHEAVQVVVGGLLLVIGANIAVRGLSKIFGPQTDESEAST